MVCLQTPVSITSTHFETVKREAQNENPKTHVALEPGRRSQPVRHGNGGGGHGVNAPNVKVTHDNNNVDGGTPNPSFDANNRQANETTIAISPANPSIVAAGANDYGMAPVTGDVWLGFYVSNDSGTSWFNTMVPGFPADTSAAVWPHRCES